MEQQLMYYVGGISSVKLLGIYITSVMNNGVAKDNDR